MIRKHRFVLSAAAVVLAAVPATLVVQDRLDAAERDSLERAAQRIFQRDADLSTASWRNHPAPAGRDWGGAAAEARVDQVEKRGERAKVWVQQLTTPYTTTPTGTKPEATVPYVSSHLFVFERTGDDWRLAEDLTRSDQPG
ncbi:hypothetical protein OG711_00580 [Streptomyces uncialis]|uniref:hypothetical protein n=1 Tax=Streptomyces uncialis TaxID=1048205 RepID=UPI002E32892B|nr:hypothetical protein [Streptomyces uncialis]